MNRSFEHTHPNELRHGLTNGFDRATRRRLLTHLGSDCKPCRGVVKVVAADNLPEAEGTAHLDPVAAALQHWIRVLRQEPETNKRVTPPRLYWQQRLPDVAEAFPRIVLEETFKTRDAESMAELIEMYLELEWHGLHVLAQTYQDYSSGHEWEPWDRLHITFSRLESVEISDEVQALVWLIESELAGKDRILVKMAEKFLRQFFAESLDPGYEAWLHMHQGMVSLRTGLYSEASERFVEAAILLPAECTWLRFFANYKVARLSYAATDPVKARQYLPVAEQLSSGFSPAIQHSLLWLSGNLDRLDHRFSQAEAKLLKSLRGSCEDGYREHAAFVLGDLARVYKAIGRFEELPGLNRQFLELVRGDEGRHLDLDACSRVLNVAKNLEIPDLARLRTELYAKARGGASKGSP